MKKSVNHRVLAVLFVVLAVLSFVFAGTVASKSDSFINKPVIASLDEKKDTAAELTAAAAGASVAVSLLPGDSGTSLANKLADIAGSFGISIGALYLEKYLLGILGFAGFGICIPAAMISLAWYAHKHALGLWLHSAWLKLLLIGIAMYAIIPVSEKMTSYIWDIYDTSITETISSAEETTGEINDSAESSSDDENTTDEDGSLWDSITNALKDAADSVTSGTKELFEKAKNTLSNLLEAAVITIVTTCLFPIIVLLLFKWGIDFVLHLPSQQPDAVKRLSDKL